MQRGDKIFLDAEKTVESAVNGFLAARDGVVEVMEYIDGCGYGNPVRLFICRNSKYETVAIIRQVRNSIDKVWMEEVMVFETNEFEVLKALINRSATPLGVDYFKVRDYNEENK